MLAYLNSIYPVRYTVLALCLFGLPLSAYCIVVLGWGWSLMALFALLSVVGLHDLSQTRSSVLRNYPVIGHLRFMFEHIRPEIRQYFIEDDNDANPFSRAQRSLVYQRAKGAVAKMDPG